MNTFGMIVAGLQVAAAFEAWVRYDWNGVFIYAGFAVGSAAVACK